MTTITSSIERSLQNCSLNTHVTSTNGSDSTENTLDLNSQISLPYYWEQCLDLKTGEVYYVNWKTGMREKEDPRTTGTFYSEEDEDDDDDDDDEDDDYSSYDDDSDQESSSESYSRYHQHDHYNNNGDNNKSWDENNVIRRENVLVVAGCRSCLMYFMVPKQDPICPKCCGQLLHFDHSQTDSV